jgi:hypothetical protein
VYLGSLVGDLAGLGDPASSGAGASPWLERGLTALGVAATLAVVVVVARIARRALSEVHVGDESDPAV